MRAGAADDRTLSALGESSSLALVTGGQAYMLLPHADLLEQEGNDLDSNLIATVLAGLPPHEVMHRHSVAEALEALDDGSGQAAFLLRPVTVKQIENWANDRRRMPPEDDVLQPQAAHRAWSSARSTSPSGVVSSRRRPPPSCGSAGARGCAAPW